MENNNVDYKKICHQLEAKVDRAIAMLKESDSPQSKQIADFLINALRETEECIIKGVCEIVELPE